MYHQLCINKIVFSSNLPKKYESLVQSCNVESEKFLYEPCDITIHHGKISQGEVEIYLLSEDSDISNEIFKIYQDVFISILPTIISFEKLESQAGFLIHEISHLVAILSINCYRYKKKSTEADNQTSKQIEKFQRITLNEIEKAAFFISILVNDYYLLCRNRFLDFQNIDVQKLLFSTKTFFQDDLSRLNIKTNIVSCQNQHLIWSNASAISSIFTKLFQSIIGYDYGNIILPDSELNITTINKIQNFEIHIEVTILKDFAQIYKEGINNNSWRFETIILEMKKIIELLGGKLIVEYLGQIVRDNPDNHRYKLDVDRYKSNIYEKCQIILCLPNKVG